jgi:malate synthase
MPPVEPTPASPSAAQGLRVRGPDVPGLAEILSADARGFLADLARTFTARRDELLARRRVVQARYDAGELPGFLAETAAVREASWTVAPIPADLRDRRVEITGPVDRKMVINALNSGARVFMADFEDATAPTWAAVIDGQRNLRDAVAGTISYRDEQRGKDYALGERVATLVVRPRGLHLPERHLELDGVALPGSLVDFGLYAFHNTAALVAKGSAPYYYLPKLQSHLEARWWNDVFVHAQAALGVPRGTFRATVLIETLPAAFEMDEILYELREHSAGLNCGRWDYIFSYIKTLRHHPDRVLPDRAEVGMTQPFMRAYSQLAVKTCHRRGIHAMGGMAAQIPIKGDPEANERALAKVRADKEREVRDGHDGTWVAHPGLVPTALAVFDAGMPTANQLHVPRDDVQASAAALLEHPQGGSRTELGLRHNVRVAVQYLAAWLGGTGCVPIDHLMEDAATAEISRAQVWQWLRHGADVDGAPLTAARLHAVIDDELARLRTQLGAPAWDAGHYAAAGALFRELSTADELGDFLTLPAYERILSVVDGD